MDQEKKSYICVVCGNNYSHQSSLSKHKKKEHHAEQLQKPGSTFSTCREEGCSDTFPGVQDLRSHLTAKHSFSFTEETKTFKSMEDFSDWKCKLEKQEKVLFVQRFGVKKRTNSQVIYYYCHCSGMYESQSLVKRMGRNSCKVGFYCTASMTTSIDNVSGIVTVVFCKTHYGHTNDLKFIRLTDEERRMIAEMVAGKIPRDAILDKIRDSLHCNDELERIHLLNLGDINNIVSSFGLNSIQKHSDDATSVKLLIEELKHLGTDNPIIHCKFQGEDQGELLDNLGKDDFFLMIQHPLQLKMMKELGSKGVCVDGSHGTNGYDFHLITVLVVDEFGEGFPCAWLISNREDGRVLRQFFKILRSKTGDIQAEWFMSDDADQYYTAWSDVYGARTRKLLCAWHVDRNWRSTLRSSVHDAEIQHSVYKTLCTLSGERDQEKFAIMLSQVLSDFELLPEVTKFGKYFLNTYANRPEQWATCFRLRDGINTNMFVEAFHRVFKHVYMKGKVNKRLDRCIHLLLLYVRNKGFDRISKLVKGKPTSRISDIEDRHRTSLSMDLECVSATEGGSYHVKSVAGTSEYLVHIDVNSCQFPGCQLKCSWCKVCVHSSSCDCMDSLIHGVVCKHVHLVFRYIQEQHVIDLESGPTKREPHPVDVNCVIACIASNRSTGLESMKVSVNDLLTRISLQAKDSTSPTVLKEVTRLLTTASNLLEIKTDENVRLPEVSKAPHNKCIELQHRFHSTKKIKKAQTRMAKPTVDERAAIRVNLLSDDLNSGASVSIDDHRYAEQPQPDSTHPHAGIPKQPEL